MFRPDADLGEQEQGLHVVAELPEPVAEVGLQGPELLQVAGQGQLAVEVDAQPGFGDVIRWNAGDYGVYRDGAVGVVLGGAAIVLLGWSWIDPAVSLLVALFLIASTWRLLRQSIAMSGSIATRRANCGASRG